MFRQRAGPAWTVALAAVFGGTGVLLRRMRREMLGEGRFRRGTAVAVYAAYGVHAAALVAAARQRRLALPVPRLPALWAGVGLAGVGLGLCAGGLRRFGSAGQISGTEPGELVVRGVYRYSRNPQYLGLSLILAGAGLAGRNGSVLLYTAGAGLVFRSWVRVEERHLVHQFGRPYRQYADATHRWLGVPATK
ncbi:methyltransferase family protein [Amycolatopsis palatopharyngis]|uniref:methyltransferase family protein n=1 Tax=Amycolatopsis palatopharyngis TaxID=187982 RepID=UPI0013BE9549|nr:isoprenylcysteine carboxylmethyltransferase family protein [Amycolatopsis palatopharyngis]